MMYLSNTWEFKSKIETVIINTITWKELNFELELKFYNTRNSDGDAGAEIPALILCRKAIA